MAPFRMSAEQRRYFCALCAEGNITRAAEKLYLSRQGLSRSMNRLEECVGARLFHRGKRGVELTDAGAALWRHVAEEDRAWEALLAELRRREDAAPEPVRVGLLSLYVGFEEKRRLLARFSGDAGVAVEIVHGDHDDFWRAISAGELECAVTLRPPDPFDLPSLQLADDGLAVLLGRDDPLSRHESVALSDLRGRCALHASPYKEHLYGPVPRDHGIHSEAVSPDRNLLLAHIAARGRIFIVQTEFARRLANDDVRFRPLTGAPFEMGSYLVFRRDMSPQACSVARVIAESCGREEQLDALLAKLLLSAR